MAEPGDAANALRSSLIFNVRQHINDLALVMAFFIFYICALFGGVFLYSLVHYRILKKCNWIKSIGLSFLWMILYAYLSASIADIMAAIYKSAPYLPIAIMSVIVLGPYILAVRLFIKTKHV